MLHDGCRIKWNGVKGCHHERKFGNLWCKLFEIDGDFSPVDTVRNALEIGDTYSHVAKIVEIRLYDHTVGLMWRQMTLVHCLSKACKFCYNRLCFLFSVYGLFPSYNVIKLT